jgi:hypothetical protein
LEFFEVVAHAKPQRGEGKRCLLLVESHSEVS